MKRNVVEPEDAEGLRAKVIASHITRLQTHARDSGQKLGLGIGTDQEGGQIAIVSSEDCAHLSSGLVSAFSTSGVLTLL